MRHFASLNVQSFVMHGISSAVMQVSVSRTFAETLEIERYFQGDCYTLLKSFVFDGDRYAAKLLNGFCAPAEFQAIVGFRRWYKAIVRDMKYRQPRFWTRQTDFVYCNLNTGKCFVCVDAHYWD